MTQSFKRATSDGFISPKCWNMCHIHVPFRKNNSLSITTDTITMCFFLVIISQKRKAWWGLPALNHFLRNRDRVICDEDSLHNDSVLTRLTMRHERCLPSVPRANRVSIHYICFLRLRRALLFAPQAEERCWTLCDSKAVPASQIRGRTWLWDNRAALCCFITQGFRIQSGMFDKHSINETSIHGWLYQFFFGCCRGTLKVQTRDFKAGISWKVILHCCRQKADNITTSIN